MPARRTTDAQKRAKGTFTPARSWARREAHRGASAGEASRQGRRSPNCPGELPEDARRVWRALVPLIAKRMPLTALDIDGLTSLCVLTVEKRQAEAAGRVPRGLLQLWNAAARRYGLDGSRPAKSSRRRVRPLPIEPAVTPNSMHASRALRRAGFGSVRAMAPLISAAPSSPSRAISMSASGRDRSRSHKPRSPTPPSRSYTRRSEKP